MADYSKPESIDEFNAREERLRALENGFKHDGGVIVCTLCGSLTHWNYWRRHFAVCLARSRIIGNLDV